MASEADTPTIEVTEGGHEFPVADVLTGRGAIFGKSGSGKSNTVGVVAEHLLDQNRPFIVIDTDGEYYGLKEEYEILHVGADEETCDVPVGPEHAESLARLALDERIPIIVDTSEYLDSDDKDELVRRLASELYRLERQRKVAFPIFLEEAHEFIPETNHPDETAQAIIKVAKRGRKRGLGLTVISQRPANVNKDVVTQYDWAVWHQLKWKQDYKVVREILSPDEAEAVQDLDPGEAIIDVDWLDEPRMVKFKRKNTFDAGATPGLEEFDMPEMQSIDASVIDKLHQVVEEEGDGDEEGESELRAERDRLKARVEDLREEVEDLREGETSADAEAVEALRDEKRNLEDERDDLQQELESSRERIETLEESVGDLKEERDELEDEVYGVRSATDHIYSALDALGEQAEPQPVADVDADLESRVDDLQAEIERLETENDRLRESGEAVVTIPKEYQEFYEHPTVEEAIDAAVENGESSEKAIWATVLTIADVQGGANYDEIAERAGYGDNTQVSRAVTALESRGVIEVVEESPRKMLDFAFGKMEEIERKNQMREEMDQRIEQKVN